MRVAAPAGAGEAATFGAGRWSAYSVPRPIAGLLPHPTAASRAPLRLALARISDRLVATRAWERLGFARLADYARERTGLSARQLQDLAHTSARLRELPQIEAALGAGRLGWSQARLVARVATPADQARWIAFARSQRVRELEHAVRAVDRGSLEGGGLETDDDGEDAGFKVGVQVRCTPRVRAKFHAVRALARRVAGEALPVWGCMEAVAAEALSALPVGARLAEGEDGCLSAGEGGAAWLARAPERVGPAMPPPLEPPEPGISDASADALANVCATQGDAVVGRLLTGLASADAFDLDARLRRCLALEQKLDVELGLLLTHSVRSRTYLRHGFASLEGFARERLGLSPRKTRALLRIERVAAGCPALRCAFRSGRLSWVQVQAILPVLLLAAHSKDGAERSRVQREWIEHTTSLSVRRLQADVDCALSVGLAELPSDRQTCAQTRAVAASDAGPAAEPETASFFFSAPQDVARIFLAVVCSVRRHVERATGRLPSEGTAVEWLFEHAFEAWCGNDRRAWHHLRGVHAARVHCRGMAPDALVFELGLRPGQEPLLRYAPGERLAIAAIV